MDTHDFSKGFDAFFDDLIAMTKVSCGSTEGRALEHSGPASSTAPDQECSPTSGSADEQIGIGRSEYQASPAGIHLVQPQKCETCGNDATKRCEECGEPFCEPHLHDASKTGDKTHCATCYERILDEWYLEFVGGRAG